MSLYLLFGTVSVSIKALTFHTLLVPPVARCDTGLRLLSSSALAES